MHGRVVVIRQAPEQRILLEVGPYPVLPPLGLVGVQLEFSKTRQENDDDKERKDTICSARRLYF